MIGESVFNLTIDLNALNHLGKNLYSSIPAVISEVVANSYDADATEVKIDINTGIGIITIADDGCGMTREECNHKYLTVGNPKRDTEGYRTPKYKRHFMGRKGIGKLSLFSIAKTIKVHTVKEDEGGNLQKNGFVMNFDDIQNWIKGKGKGCPLPAVNEADIEIEKGTIVILSDLKKDLLRTEIYLRRRLARRFSVIGEKYNFSVVINGQPITIADRAYFKNVQYLWYIGEYGTESKEHCINVERTEELDGVVDAEQGYKISGWVGTFDERKSIKEGNNTIIIRSWGKTIHEDILRDTEEGGIYIKYVIGEISADFLDADDKDDIATSDRQSVKEDDPRFIILRDYIRDNILKNIQRNWTKWRKKGAEKRAVENEKVREWFGSLEGDMKKYARELFMKIESFPIEKEEDRRTIYKHAILAFQNLALRKTLSTLDVIQTNEQLEVLLETLRGVDQLEAMHYHEITRSRISTLEKFVDIVPASSEKIIQKYIFEHLWLLDPSWERADTTPPLMEQTVLKEFGKIDAKLTPEEKAGRIDIRYKTAAGKNIIIELKKYTVEVDVHDLAKQIAKYHDALRKCLESEFPHEQHQIEVICILGSPPTGGNEDRISLVLQGSNGRYMTYARLIKDALGGYRDYLEKQKEVNRIQEIVNSI